MYKHALVVLLLIAQQVVLGPSGTIQLQTSSGPIVLVTASIVASNLGENGYCTSSETPLFGNDGLVSGPQSCNYTARAASPSNGTVRVANVSADLQPALNAALCGDIVQLAAGVTFVGNYTLPAKNCDAAHWITIRTSAIANLPAEDARVTPCYFGVASLPGRPNFNCASTTNFGATIQSLTTGSKQPFALTSGTRFIRFEGVRFRPDPTNAGNITPLIVTDTGVAGGVDHIVFDQVWCHGNATDEVQRCTILANSNHVSFVNSFLTDFHCISGTGTCSDAQALLAGLGGGPTDGTYKFYNNFLEASGENFLSGGGGGASTPFDFEFRRNHLFKPQIWNPRDPTYNGGVGGHAFIVKNIFELKNAQRVFLEGNVLENSWSGFSQVGEAITITPANQGGNCPLCFISNVIVRFNWIRDVLQVFQPANVGGGVNNDVFAAAGNNQIYHDNVADNVDAANACGQGCSTTNVGAGTAYTSSVMLAGNPDIMKHIKFDHNTIVPATVTPAGTWPQNAFLLDGPKNTVSGVALQDDYTNTNSIFPAGNFAIGAVFGANPPHCADNQSMANIAAWFNACWLTWSLTNNAIVGGTHVNWNWPPNGGVAFPAAYVNVGFVNYNNGSGGDYRLCTGVNAPAAPCAGASPYHNAGTDGKDIGADIVTVTTLTAGVTGN